MFVSGAAASECTGRGEVMVVKKGWKAEVSTIFCRNKGKGREWLIAVTERGPESENPHWDR